MTHAPATLGLPCARVAAMRSMGNLLVKTAIALARTAQSSTVARCSAKAGNARSHVRCVARHAGVTS